MRISVFRSLFSVLVALAVFGSCAAQAQNPAALSATNVNLIFVVSEDLAYNSAGDINTKTANLTDQGLRRSLLLASFLQKSVLGSHNVTAIYALEPMTHLQTASNYPDMAALAMVEPFALLNHIALGSPAVTNNSFPLNNSYASGQTTAGVAKPHIACKSCQGLAFSDPGGDNEALAEEIITAKTAGYYVFSAPWEVISALIENVNKYENFKLTPPTSYVSPNTIYAISITSAGTAKLLTYNSNLKPTATYPALPKAVTTGACTAKQFSISVTGGVGGAVIPAKSNTNEVAYFIRHAEAHPSGGWDDGNYVCAGQWRALDLPNALKGKIAPQLVYSIDPAQVIGGSVSASGNSDWSYVRPALTVEPYAIANGLPLNLAADFELFAQNPPVLATNASNFFFTGGKFTGQKLLVAWEHNRIPTTVDALLASYYPKGGAPVMPTWASGDYDSIWTVTLDAKGNLTVSNASCEGIVSADLPATCPAF